MKNKMQKYTDKYFLRANEILKAEEMNPWVNMQVFVRKGPGRVAGVNEAIDLIAANSNIEQVGGRIYAKSDINKIFWNESQTHLHWCSYSGFNHMHLLSAGGSL